MNRFLTMAACVLMAHPVLAADTSPRPQLRPADLVTSTVQTYMKYGMEVRALPADFNGEATLPPHETSFDSTQRKSFKGIPTSYYVPDDWTTRTSPLSDIKVPENWQLVKNLDEYTKRSSEVPGLISPHDPELCAQIIANEWYNHVLTSFDNTAQCATELGLQAHEGYYEPFEQAINGLYRGGFHILDTHRQDYTHTYAQVLYRIVLTYALYRDELNLEQPKEVIDQWLADRADNFETVNFDSGNNTIQPRCSAERMIRVITYVDDCNDTRLKVTMAKIVMGLQTGNQELFDEGIEYLHYINQFYDEQGVYMGTAMRGGQAIHYSQGWLGLTAILTEILATVGYDYTQHILPTGMSVQDMITFNHSYLWSDNIEPLIPYAKLSMGEKGASWRTLGKQSHTHKEDNIYHNIRWAKHTGTPIPIPEGYLADYVVYPNAIYWANR